MIQKLVVVFVNILRFGHTENVIIIHFVMLIIIGMVRLANVSMVIIRKINIVFIHIKIINVHKILHIMDIGAHAISHFIPLIIKLANYVLMENNGMDQFVLRMLIVCRDYNIFLRQEDVLQLMNVILMNFLMD